MIARHTPLARAGFRCGIALAKSHITPGEVADFIERMYHVRTSSPVAGVVWRLADMGRRALIVGINQYDNLGPSAALRGALPDALSVAASLARHHNRDPNYDCVTMTSGTPAVTRTRLREALERLFRGAEDDVLFYFSGHGTVTDAGGYILTQDAEPKDLGFSMDELLTYANKSRHREAVIILDCCMSGGMGDPQEVNYDGDYQRSLLRQNVSILAASRHNEEAMETGGQGLFTALLLDALDGDAANILGNVTLPSVYAHIEGALGPWDQRPIYKTYTTTVSIIRRAAPHIQPVTLRKLTELFPTQDAGFQLSPNYEYDETPVTDEQKIGQLFKRFRDVGLVCAEQEGQDFYWAAMHSKGLRLTKLGRHFWRLIDAGRI